MDRSTVSILPKAVKGGNCSHHDVRNAMTLLDRIGPEVCTLDGVLLNVTLEACMQHRERQRLQTLPAAWERSHLQPSFAPMLFQQIPNTITKFVVQDFAQEGIYIVVCRR